MPRHFAAQTEVSQQQVHLAEVAAKQRVLLIHAIEASNDPLITVQNTLGAESYLCEGMS